MPNGDQPTLASTIDQLRESRNLSKAELARGLKLSPSLVGRYLTGEVKPGINHLARIAEYFGVDRERLEMLAGYRANTSATEQAPIDPEVAAMLDNDRAETLEMLEGIPSIFHVSVMNAQRDARKNVVQAIRHAVSQLVDTQLAHVDKDSPNLRNKGEPGPSDELSVRYRSAQTISSLLTAAY